MQQCDTYLVLVRASQKLHGLQVHRALQSLLAVLGASLAAASSYAAEADPENDYAYHCTRGRKRDAIFNKMLKLNESLSLIRGSYSIESYPLPIKMATRPHAGIPILFAISLPNVSTLFSKDFAALCSVMTSIVPGISVEIRFRY